MDNANGDSTGSSLFDTTIIWWLIWVGTAITFLLCPFIGSSNRRKLCAARIRERQWDVDVEMDRESSWYRAAAERYERYVHHEKLRVVSFAIVFARRHISS